MKDFSKKEKEWLKKADTLFKQIPKFLKLYVCDTEIIVCKVGQSADNVIGSIPGSNINCCCAVTDVHDDMDFGRN